MLLFSELSTSVNGITFSLEEMVVLEADTDTAAIQAVLDEVRTYRDNIDLTELHSSTVFAPETGFLPTPSQLKAAGYPQTADDVTLQKGLENIVQNLQTYSNTFTYPVNLETLESSDEECEELNVQLGSLNPSIHGWGLARDTVNDLFAIMIPRFFVAMVGSIEDVILSDGLVVTRRLGAQTSTDIARLPPSERRVIVFFLFGFLTSAQARIVVFRKKCTTLSCETYPTA